MTRAPAGPAALVRVSVASATRRVDLVLPGAVPVAELVPELARSVGLLDRGVVHAGYRLVTSRGRELVADEGLAAQGVEDGGLLTVAARIEDEPPRAYDDVVEAMADVVEQDLAPWDPDAGRRVALCAVVLAMGLGAAALLLERGSLVAGVFAAVIAVVLSAVAIVLSRLRHETEPAVAAAWLATAYAAVAGLVLVTVDDRLVGLPFAGGAMLVSGLGCLVGLRDGRALVMPPAVVGAILVAAGLLLRAVELAPAAVASTTLVVVVLAGGAFPRLALGVTGFSADGLADIVDTAAEHPVDRARVAGDALVAHEILVGLSATLGVLLVLVAPVAAVNGVAGTVLAVSCCLLVVLRTRRHRSASEVLVGLVSGIAGLTAVAVAVLWLQPAWRPVAAMVLAGAGASLLAASVLPPSASMRRGWLGDLAESVALLTLLPVLVVASGLFSVIRS
jgi:type VII secretion integral membrane protein EccD